jgi:hypothetical protein
MGAQVPIEEPAGSGREQKLCLWSEGGAQSMMKGKNRI